jgi:YD repeat-containing protein
MRQHAAISGTSWDKTSMIADYGENATYDGNGNILSYIRKGTGTSLQMDRLAYLYNRSSNGWLLNNQLQYVKDTVATSTYAGDLTTQAADNYTYDKIGNLTKDVTTAITNIDWSVYGKIQTIYKGTGNLVYTYDASGHRVSKTLGTSTTWYVRDAQGNALGVYDNSNSTITWKEQQLYGSSRLGLWTPNLNVGTGNTSTPNTEYGIAGRKYYELNNHLGNVVTTISDKRLQPAPTSLHCYYLM